MCTRVNKCAPHCADTIAVLAERLEASLAEAQGSNHDGVDWGGVEAAGLARCCARPGTVWLLCCGLSSPLASAESPAVVLRRVAGDRLAGSWHARTAALALLPGSLSGIVLSHCLEDQLAPLSQLDEALRVLRPGGQLSIWIWGGRAPNARIDRAVARRSLAQLKRWAASRPLQLTEMVCVNRVDQALRSRALGELPPLQRWWLQRNAELLRLDYRHSDSQPLGLRRLLPHGRRVSVPAQGLSRV